MTPYPPLSSPSSQKSRFLFFLFFFCFFLATGKGEIKSYMEWRIKDAGIGVKQVPKVESKRMRLGSGGRVGAGSGSR